MSRLRKVAGPIGILTALALTLTPLSGAYADSSKRPVDAVTPEMVAQVSEDAHLDQEEAAFPDSPGLGSRDFGSGKIDPSSVQFVEDFAITPLATPSACGGSLPQTSTQYDGVPGPNFWKLMQCFARMNGYTGPIDGVMGPNSWKGVQHGLRFDGYNITPTGVHDAYTNKALQRLGSNFCYTGPIDGVMGPYSWASVARYVNRYGTGTYQPYAGYGGC